MPSLSTIEEILDEARSGCMFILVDDEDRENEGDLVIPAQMATPAAINFMAKHGRGLICLALTRPRAEELGLRPMTDHNLSRHGTAFTVSIEAREGVTTGISAPDRARTIAVTIDPSKGKNDIMTPGHVFPLIACDGGVLVRTGHTEAAVDIARLAGLNPSGVICEIMNDDGTMARLPELLAFAQRHGLKVGKIADLIAYRRRTEKLIERNVETRLHSVFGGVWRMIVYHNKISYAEHIALVKGNLSDSGPVVVRMHALDVLDDVLGEQDTGRWGVLHAAMEMVAGHGRGAVVLLREPRPTALSERVRARNEGERPSGDPLRDYGVGAQILLDLGVRNMTLLTNNPKTIIGLEGYGLTVVGHRPIPVAASRMATKEAS
ncbi:MAG: 3 4-dihydroxy 2-butanone 4-phosphate synthase / GTP cyclohydrolase II [Rhodospirillaceae bacterium]|nr:MAG: 3 4-dihydroxy 2-butanone 4-phosphate synthase / GTP cyclohydrolase II [Rhodospirillaceae bacterium]